MEGVTRFSRATHYNFLQYDSAHVKPRVLFRVTDWIRVHACKGDTRDCPINHSRLQVPIELIRYGDDVPLDCTLLRRSSADRVTDKLTVSVFLVHSGVHSSASGGRLVSHMIPCFLMLSLPPPSYRLPVEVFATVVTLYCCASSRSARNAVARSV